ncbi:hypothetical protein A3A70_01575 [candidate division WWE3 bacterium RIFCSPLOWO2_01_FULL_42_11]|uniref:BioF2-like acetyltransferase domain-containing protein n=1 Tax=candidate division WWE3 bacterium RIFCSPLOWO2_01_FULL_42_11 TaxID=1802627 RepID=A0A1F4VR24_UNCKA|nr:MAG: hypothetical protein A3A70_01575 [candidate division WWE3 bacterium RIFCSPLOWO2_01_FULL_42_11]
MELYPDHICQSPEWAEFKTKMGTQSVKAGEAFFTIHSLPLTPFSVGYCPRVKPENLDLEKFIHVAQHQKCTHVKIDVPNAPETFEPKSNDTNLKSAKPTFSTATFMIDLSPSKELIISKMHHKTRYNIRLSDKKGIKVERDGDIETFLSLQRETAKRQGFFVHSDHYYRTLWDLFSKKDMAFIVTARLEEEPLASLFLMKYKDTLYYPYGGSSVSHKDAMAPNSVMWEAIRLGKDLGCEQFDMWGALANPSPDHPWAGFHRFKEGFGAQLVKYPGSWDLILNRPAYEFFKVSDDLRWKFLGLMRS